MLFHTHLLFGILLFLISIDFFKGNIILILFLILLGSVLPDIDKTNSKLGRKIKLIGLVFGHRTFFHSLFFPIFCLIVLTLLTNLDYGLALFLGVMSHLISDSLTPAGINFFYPLKFKLSGPIKTGGILEYVFMFFIAVTIVYFIF
jgi:inner membrane protein